jgi:hypothetical protein
MNRIKGNSVLKIGYIKEKGDLTEANTNEAEFLSKFGDWENQS